MSSDRMETEQTTKTNETGDYREQLDALEKQGFKKFKYNYRLLKRTGGNLEIVKAFLEAEEKTKQNRREERKKRKSDYSSSSSSSSEEEKPWKKGKRERKEQKNKSKVFKKIHKKERKEHRNNSSSNSNSNTEPINEAIIDLSGSNWPAEGQNLYLDGNNMLFVLGPIRKLALQGRRSDAELVLQQFAEEFAKKMGLTRCTLIYDSTKKNVLTSTFVVCSARPQFATSDDALVAWASQPGGKGLYVTSDRGLIERLTSVGSSICKPKQWFAFAASIISGGPVEDLESWIQTWMDRQEASTLFSNNNA